MKQLLFTLRYLRYYFFSGNEHSIHSPFVFDLYNNVIKVTSPYYSFDKIEATRAKMILSNEKISVTDFGTGGKGKIRKLALRYIALNYVKKKKHGQLLFRLVNYFHSQNILEMGTSLGISTLYMAAPDSKSKVITLEGCPETASVAKKNFELNQVNNIEQIIGEFDSTLSSALKIFSKLDFVFFDGNHRKKETLSYFNSCLKKYHSDSIFVFDDIHWSNEMTDAWEKIKNDERVTISVDLFFTGIIFFRQGQPKQHFVLRF